MDIPLFKVFMSPFVDSSLSSVLHSGFIGQGKVVDIFESELSSFFNHYRVLSVNSCTSSIHLALHMIRGCGRDEVLTVPVTCTASNLPILANGLRPVFVDTDVRNCNIDLVDLGRKINERTLAVLIVHWAGYPVDMHEVERILDNAESVYGFRPYLIEDCAHAFGSKYMGRNVGTWGFGCYSFGPIKHLTCGDGGALLCPSSDFYDRGKLLRWYGLDRSGRSDFRCEQEIVDWGYKFHMNDINACIGLENLRVIKPYLDQQKFNGEFLDKTLDGFSGIRLVERVTGYDSAHWVYTLLVDDRDKFISKMKSCGISCSRVHDRNDKHPCLGGLGNLQGTDYVIERMVSIPCGWWVGREDLEYIVSSVRSGW